MAAPILRDFSASLVFSENAVNASPQIIDTSVLFTDAEDDFNGGTLVLSGALAEDRFGIQDEGLGIGQIGYDASTGAVTYSGTQIGTATGGAGTSLTVTFNAAATVEAITRLIPDLTYANVSDFPTAARDITLTVTDASGASNLGAFSFTQRTGASNPFTALVSQGAALARMDLDHDGDYDMFVLEDSGAMRYFRNTGTEDAPFFTEQTGVANPLSGIDFGAGGGRPYSADPDDDGDFDLVVDDFGGGLRYFENTGTSTAPAFTERTGTDNPYNRIDQAVSGGASPASGDFDGDGDSDIVIGTDDGLLRYFQNTGTASAASFTELISTSNPFIPFDVGDFARPFVVDLDNDGKLDVVVGEQDGNLNFLHNITVIAPFLSFEQSAVDNQPFLAIDVGMNVIAADFNDDGLQDLAVAGPSGDGVTGKVFVFDNTTPLGAATTVNVQPQQDAPRIDLGSAPGTGYETTYVTGGQRVFICNSSTIEDPDDLTIQSLTITLANRQAGDVIDTLGLDRRITKTYDEATGVLTLTGEAALLNYETLLNLVYYKNTADDPALGPRFIRVAAVGSDGSGVSNLATATINVQGPNQAPNLTEINQEIYLQRTAAIPQGIDGDVIFRDPEDNFGAPAGREFGAVGQLSVASLGQNLSVRIDIAETGTGPGQISKSGDRILYEGVEIGTFRGAGTTKFEVSFTADADSQAIEALIEHVTYADLVGVANRAAVEFVISDADGAETKRTVTLLFPGDVLQIGDEGDNRLIATDADDNIDGRGGNDTVVWRPNLVEDYFIHVFNRGGPAVYVSDEIGTGGEDTAINAENLEFSNVTLSNLSPQQNHSRNVDGGRFDAVVYVASATGQVIYKTADVPLTDFSVFGEVPAGFRPIGTGQLTDDFKADLGAWNETTGEVISISRADDGTLATAIIAVGLTAAAGYDVLGFSLHDGDHLSDLDVRGPGGAHYARLAHAYYNSPVNDQTFGWQVQGYYGSEWEYAGTADFAGDFRDYGLSGRGTIQSPDGRLYAMPLDLTLSGAPSEYIELGSAPGSDLKAVTDLNGDGKGDIVVQNPDTFEINWLDAATISNRAQWSLDSGGWRYAGTTPGFEVIHAADLNNDRSWDLILQHEDTGETVSLDVEAGTFSPFSHPTVDQSTGESWLALP